MSSRFKLFCVLWIVVLILGGAAFADNKVGNGGMGIFCPGSEPQLLDFFENAVHFETKETKPQVIAESQFKRLAELAPALANLYLKRLSEIPGELEMKKNVELTNTKDSKHLFRPASVGCEVQQIIIRRKDPLMGEPRFLVSADLWDRLSPIQQAGLLSHEIVYEHLYKLGEEDSVKARKLNAYLYSKLSDKNELWKFIKDLQIPLYP